MRLRTVLIAILPVIAALGLWATHAAPQRSGAMSIQIVRPHGPVTVIAGGKIPLDLKVTGITLNMSAMGRKNKAGEGHYHYYVDCIPQNSYSVGILSGCWAYANAMAGKTSFDLSASHVKIGLGTHMLMVALAQNNHILYRVPPAVLIFTVVRPKMSIQIVRPTSAVTVEQGAKIPLDLKVTGIKLSMSAMGHKAVAGEGHYHYYVDCIPPNSYSTPTLRGCWAYAGASAGRTSFDLSASHVKIRPGTHMLMVALARNDHILYRVPAANLVFTVLRAR
jgi:hypothetical protein